MLTKQITTFFSLSVLAEQAFLETPKSQNVTINTTVILKCVIRDKVGENQWTKDGVALGY